MYWHERCSCKSRTFPVSGLTSLSVLLYHLPSLNHRCETLLNHRSWDSGENRDEPSADKFMFTCLVSSVWKGSGWELIKNMVSQIFTINTANIRDVRKSEEEQNFKARWTRKNITFYTYWNALKSHFLNCLMNNKKMHSFDITGEKRDRMDRSRMELMNHTWILDSSCTEGWSICSLSIRFFNSLIPASSSFKPSSASSMTCIGKLNCLKFQQ